MFYCYVQYFPLILSMAEDIEAERLAYSLPIEASQFEVKSDGVIRSACGLTFMIAGEYWPGRLLANLRLYSPTAPAGGGDRTPGLRGGVYHLDNRHR